MDTEKKIDDKSKKPESVHKKKHESKKPGKANGPPEGRGRAKSTLVNPFDNKKPLNTKKENKPIETFGQNRFQNLLSMFDKKPAENNDNKEDTGPKKLDMSKFSAFNKDNNNADNQNDISKRNTVVSDSIKQRMDALLNANKNNKTSSGSIDPVLEQRKKLREQDEENFDDSIGDDYSDDDGFDDHISEENDKGGNNGNDSWSDSDEEKKAEKNDNTIQNKEEKETVEKKKANEYGSDTPPDSESEDENPQKEEIKTEEKNELKLEEKIEPKSEEIKTEENNKSEEKNTLITETEPLNSENLSISIHEEAKETSKNISETDL